MAPSLPQGIICLIGTLMIYSGKSSVTLLGAVSLSDWALRDVSLAPGE